MKTARIVQRGIGWLGALCLFTLAASGQQAWTRIWGSVSDDYVDGVTVDTGNGIYVVGGTYGSFDSQVNPDPGAGTSFLTKYTADGTRQWSDLWGPTNAGAGATAVAVDSSINIYVAGNTDGAFDGQLFSAKSEPFLTKFNASGTKQWTRLWGKSNAWNSAAAVAVDSTSNIYVTGSTYQGTGPFDGQTGTGQAFLTKFTAAGTRLWSRILGSGTNDGTTAIAVDRSGTNIYVAGQTEGSFDGLVPPAGGYGAFLCKYNPSGTRVWTRFAVSDNVGFPAVTGLAMDDSNNVIVSGEHLVSTNWGFMAKYTMGGSQLWFRTYTKDAEGMTADASGQIYRVTSMMAGNLYIGNEVTKLSSVGTELSHVDMPAGSNDWARGIAVASNGTVYVAGDTRGGLTNGPITSGNDAFLTALNIGTQSISAVYVLASPAYAGSVAGGGSYLVGSNVTLTATAAPGWVFFRWNDYNTSASRAITVPAVSSTYTAYFVMGLGVALNATNLDWTTGGAANWYVQTATTHDGVAAACSGTINTSIAPGQQSWLQTTVTGPGSLLFWGKISTYPSNTVQFFMNTQLVSYASGNVDWSEFVTFIGSTQQVTLKWEYTKNSNTSSGSEACWLDQVTWIPSLYVTNAPQIFYQDPGNLIASWVLNSTGGVETVRLLGLTPGWPIKAAGDINGDGVSDLIFQSSGWVAVWFMNADGSVRGSKVIGNADGWEVRACGDFFGTGRAQLFFQNGSTVAYWQMDTNGNFQSAGIYPGLGSWQLRGVGRVAGANKGEAFFMNGGFLAIWFRDDGTGNIAGVLACPNPALPVSAANPAYYVGPWQICGVVDIDRDGTSDLLWQTPDGWTASWFMQTNGAARSTLGWGNVGLWKMRAGGR
jgi:hypothetical protein